MSPRRSLVIGLAVVALAGCGEDREGSVEESGGATTTTGTDTGTSTAPAPTGAAVAKVRVTETEYALDPKNPRIAKAGVVSFLVKNAGKIPHALEVEGPKGEVETKAIDPGASATLKVDLSRAGTYEWYCPISDHKGRGMKGRITVAGGGSGKGSGDSGKGSGDSGKGGGDSGKGSDDSGKGSGDSGKGGGDSGNRSGAGSSGGNGVY